MAENEGGEDHAHPPSSHPNPPNITTLEPSSSDPTPSPMPETRRTSSSSGAGGGGGGGGGGGNMVASQTSVESSNPSGTTSRRGHRSRPLDYGTIPGTSPFAARTQSTPQRTSRPSFGPRIPSSVAPHRGQEFSVDDDPAEVNSDLRLARARARQEQQQHRERQLRRQQSTLRRRPTAQLPTLQTVESDEREEDLLMNAGAQASGNDATAHQQHGQQQQQPQLQQQADSNGDPSSEETLQGEEEEEAAEELEELASSDDEGEDVDGDAGDDDDDDDLSDAESFTLKDRQEAINETHPFGIRIWKPALYKKNRSVQRNAEGDIHSAPGGNVSRWLFVFNLLWTVVFGWWLALLSGVGGVINMVLAFVLGITSCHEYGHILISLAAYLFYPFGKFVKLEHDEAYLDEDEGEGRSISEYERWQTGDLEEGRLFFGPTDINRSLIGRRRDEVDDLLEPAADETDGLLGRRSARDSDLQQQQQSRMRSKKRLFGRGKWTFGRVIFFLSFYCLITPALFLVSGVCWFFVFTIPMGKVALLLFYHLRRHPLALSFHTDSHYARVPSMPRGSRGSSILLCTYRAVGLKYWKYTIDGTNIFLINLLGLVIFAIFDYFVLYSALGWRSWVQSLGLIFVLALASIIPLAYFIGQAVASISAQSSMGVGATINAFFSTIVEVFLYCVALKEGKAQLVEGSIIGSIFAGILFLPGLSMCFGAIKRKTQRFNVKSAGVTSTMLLFAVIGAFSPTLFYQIYGSHELYCHQCTSSQVGGRDCRRCYFAQIPAVQDRFFLEAVRPYIWFAAVCLFLSYVVGLLFTLRTHAAVIWNNEPDEKKDAIREDALRRWEERHGSGAMTASVAATNEITPTSSRPGAVRSDTVATLHRENIRDSPMYKRILNQSLRQAGLSSPSPRRDGGAQLPPPTPITEDVATPRPDGQQMPFLVPPKSTDGVEGTMKTVRIKGLSVEDNRALVQQVAEMAATAATVAARDATKTTTRSSTLGSAKHISGAAAAGVGSGRDHGSGNVVETSSHHDLAPEISSAKHPTAPIEPALPPAPHEHPENNGGGHDAPNWSRTKSAVILLTATLAYAVIAEILVDTVDAVLSGSDLDEKFLGITLFALVPNTTEFLNAISFAMNGNVALSMEIGSSYALQVMLLQIPCLVLYSAIYAVAFLSGEGESGAIIDHTFSMIFPQWDMVTVILGVFLMGYVVGEGKSNYFKGSTLIFSYLVVAVGFWFSGFGDLETRGINPSDTLALGGNPNWEVFKTIGMGRGGVVVY
ncbi:MAG: hypothetical protein FE78DRAFT_90217 [Acidomyces sp. 'richmondensis']|nr:MAG: hypothetical protein FE78DRAFT_90217 [Acidomyces sp. 'richmondensis']